jgi:hypothetical protein
VKKQLPGFFAGIFVTVIAFATIPALAASFQTIEATLNSVNIKVNGDQVASIGENYTLDNGKHTATSIVFNETTYVPIRRIGELLDAEIGWDQSSGSVTIRGKDATTPTAPSTDYSNWSSEDKISYQEFKGLWKFVPMGESAYDRFVCVGGTTENLEKFLLKTAENKTIMYVERLSEETFEANSEKTNMMFFYFCGVDLGDYLWYTTCYSDGVRENQFEQDKVLKMISP